MSCSSFEKYFSPLNTREKDHGEVNKFNNNDKAISWHKVGRDPKQFIDVSRKF